MSVDTLVSIVNHFLPEPHAGLLNGILFGTKVTMSRDLVDALTKTGTLHIVALSGMNISIVATLVAHALLPVVSRRIASLLTIIVIIGYVWFVGISPSVIRAAIMGSITLIATALGKRPWAIWSLVIAVMNMLVLNPLWVGDIGFLLSVFATLGIVLFGGSREGMGKINNWIDRTIQSIKDNLRVTLAAQVFTIPIILFFFHRISLISPVPNLLIGWTMAPITIIGFILVISGIVFAPLGYPVSWVAWLFLQYILLIIDWTSKIPFASVGW